VPIWVFPRCTSTGRAGTEFSIRSGTFVVASQQACELLYADGSAATHRCNRSRPPLRAWGHVPRRALKRRAVPHDRPIPAARARPRLSWIVLRATARDGERSHPMPVHVCQASSGGSDRRFVS
jgi:hypothetical protein